MSKPIAYVLFNHKMDWESFIATDPKFAAELNGCDGWYIGGEVNSLEELFKLFEEHDFDAEYYYNFIDDMPHWLYNLLNKEDTYNG